MKRLDFIKTCGLACVSASVLGSVMQSCASANRFAKSEIVDNKLKVALSEFAFQKDKQTVYLPFVIVQNDTLNYPILLHRNGEKDFTAVWMKCSHQGTELTVHGGYLSCPSHGSEFDATGKVTQGPATQTLRSFKTIVDDTHVSIVLA